MPGVAGQYLEDLKNDLEFQKNQKRYYEVRLQNSNIYTRNREDIEQFCRNYIESIEREIGKLQEEIENYCKANPNQEEYIKNLQLEAKRSLK